MPPGPQGGERHETAASPGEMARLMESDSEELWNCAVGPREGLFHCLGSQSTASPGGRERETLHSGNPLQYTCLEKPMDRGAWQATVHGVTKSRTPPPTHTHTRARARAHVAYLGRLLSGASHTSPLLSPASLTRPAQLVWGVSLSPGARQGTGAQEGTQLGTLLWGHEGRRPQPLPRYSWGGSRRPRSLPLTNNRSSLPWLDCRWRSGIGSTIKTRQAWCTGSPTSCCP